MSTLGWLLLGVGAILMQAVFKGHATDSAGNFTLPQYFDQVLTGLITGNTTALKAADGAAPGLGVDVPASLNVATGPVDASGSTGSVSTTQTPSEDAALLATAKRLGGAAKGYIMGATGPNYYDCSGLMWRAMVATYGIHEPRFVTGNLLTGPWRKYLVRCEPHEGALVLWHTHIGCVESDPTLFYSARSPSRGIGTSPIRYSLPNEPAPTYWKVVVAHKLTQPKMSAS